MIRLRFDGQYENGWLQYTILDSASPAFHASFVVKPGQDVQARARETEARYHRAEAIEEEDPESWKDELRRADDARRAREYRKEVGR